MLVRSSCINRQLMGRDQIIRCREPREIDASDIALLVCMPTHGPRPVDSLLDHGKEPEGKRARRKKSQKGQPEAIPTRYRAFASSHVDGTYRSQASRLCTV